MHNTDHHILNMAGETHIGLHRVINEDNFCYTNRHGETNKMAMIADGIGGHPDGALASRLCCQFMLKVWHKCGIGNETDPELIRQTLLDGTEQCNRFIYQMNRNKNPKKPMGTTMVMAIFTPEHIITGYAGDSRFYIVSDSAIEYLTVDHSLVVELAKQKKITVSEIIGHPYSHIILRSIGTTPKAEIETSIQHRHPGQRFLLCSDGLNRYLSDSQIIEIIKNSPTPKSAVNSFVRSTLQSGADDNVAVICIF